MSMIKRTIISVFLQTGFSSRSSFKNKRNKATCHSSEDAEGDDELEGMSDSRGKSKEEPRLSKPQQKQKRKEERKVRGNARKGNGLHCVQYIYISMERWLQVLIHVHVYQHVQCSLFTCTCTCMCTCTCTCMCKGVLYSILVGQVFYLCPCTRYM